MSTASLLRQLLGARVRTIIFVAAAILLAGCQTDDDFWRPSHYFANEQHESTAAQAQPVDQIDSHCQAVARQRAADARANGYSLDMEKTIYDGTYQDCMAWDTSHRS